MANLVYKPLLFFTIHWNNHIFISIYGKIIHRLIIDVFNPNILDIRTFIFIAINSRLNEVYISILTLNKRRNVVFDGQLNSIIDHRINNRIHSQSRYIVLRYSKTTCHIFIFRFDYFIIKCPNFRRVTSNQIFKCFASIFRMSFQKSLNNRKIINLFCSSKRFIIIISNFHTMFKKNFECKLNFH